MEEESSISIHCIGDESIDYHLVKIEDKNTPGAQYALQDTIRIYKQPG